MMPPAALPPFMTQNLTDKQLARVVAATTARELLRSSDGMMKVPAPRLEDLINLTHFLLTGAVDPGVFLPGYPAAAEDGDPWWVRLDVVEVTDGLAVHYMARVPEGTVWNHTHDCMPHPADPTVHCSKDAFPMALPDMVAWLDAGATVGPPTVLRAAPDTTEEPSDDDD